MARISNQIKYSEIIAIEEEKINEYSKLIEISKKKIEEAKKKIEESENFQNWYNKPINKEIRKIQGKMYREKKKLDELLKKRK